jgi:hypothetical protein
MKNFPIYLRNYTNVEFVLAYDIEDGSYRIMPVADALDLKKLQRGKEHSFR